MGVTEETYTTPPPTGNSRTLASLHTNCSFARPSKYLGSKHPPLIELEPSKYVLDELHLLLRVSDILFRNLIYLADHLDQTKQLREGRTGNQIPHLEDMVKSCGVPFQISQVNNQHHYKLYINNTRVFITCRCIMRMEEL